MADEQYFNQSTGLYEYPVVDLKTGAQAIMPAKTPKTAEHIAEKGYRLLSQPQPDANVTMAGVAPGSPTVNAAKTAAEMIVPALGAAAGPEIAGGSLLNRAAGAALGGMGGQLLVKPASQGRMPTSPEMIAEALTAGSGEGIASALIHGTSEAELIGQSLRKIAGVGDTAIKIVKKNGVPLVLGNAASDVGASRTLLGRDILTALPKMTEPINQTEHRMYTNMARTAAEDGVRISIPNRAQQAAAFISEDLGDPASHLEPKKIERLKSVLDRIANFGEERVSVQTKPSGRLVEVPPQAVPQVSSLPSGSTRLVPRERTSEELMSSQSPTVPTTVGSEQTAVSGPQSGLTLAGGPRAVPNRSVIAEPTNAQFLRGQRSQRDLAGGKRPKPTMSVNQYQTLLREVRDLAPEYADRLMPGDYEDGIMAGLNKMLHLHLDEAVKGTRAEQLLADAKRYHQEVKVRFRDNVGAALKPADQALRYVDVMDLLVDAKNPTNLSIAMNHLPDDLRVRMRQSWLNHNVIGPATDTRTGLFNPKPALDALQKLTPETRHALFQNSTRDVETIMQQLAQEMKNREGITAKMVAGSKIVLPFSYGAYKIMQGDFRSAVPALLGGAAGLAIMSHVLASPTMARYFARGLETPTGSRLARRYGQLLMHAIPGELLQIVTAPDAEPGSPRAIGQQFPQYPQPGIPGAATTSP